MYISYLVEDGTSNFGSRRQNFDFRLGVNCKEKTDNLKTYTNQFRDDSKGHKKGTGEGHWVGAPSLTEIFPRLVNT